MIKIIEQEISFDDTLKKKLEFICDFCNTTPKFINGSIRKIDKTNLSYIEPHRIIINDITFLAFNYSTEIYIKNLRTFHKYRYQAYIYLFYQIFFCISFISNHPNMLKIIFSILHVTFFILFSELL